MTLERVGFGGGCHWCTEAVFQALHGVARVQQGYIVSVPPDHIYSEAVLVHFNAARIDLDTLIEVHLHTHASTSNHALRGKYRSAIYYSDAAQSVAAKRGLARMQRQFKAPLVTRVLAYAGFRPSDARFSDYYARGPERPFCQRYIEPKLKLVSERYARQTG